MVERTPKTETEKKKSVSKMADLNIKKTKEESEQPWELHQAPGGRKN